MEVDVEEGAFTVVKKRKNKKKGPKGNASTAKESRETGVLNNKGKRDTVREKVRLEKMKAAAPPKAFIVSKGDLETGEVRKKVWTDLLKVVGTPQVRGTYVLPKVNLLIKPADRRTFDALKGLETTADTSVKVREESARWPKILIYDIGRELDRESIPGLVAEQNPTLGLSREEAKEAIVPVFKKGPKSG